MEIDKIFGSEGVGALEDNAFNAISSSILEVKALQKRKAAENVQIVVQALKKIEADLRGEYGDVADKLAERIASIKDGQDGRNGADGRNGKDGRPGRDGSQGAKGNDGLPGRDGVDGTDGVSVRNAFIDFDGSLIIDLSNGQSLNVGEVVAPDLAEKIKVINTMSTNSAVVINDEGVTISPGVKSLNFVGATVTATASGDDVTVNVSAGTGSVTSVDVSGGTTGLTTTGGPVTTSGTIALGGTLGPSNGGTGLTSLGAGVAAFLGTPTSANLAAAVTNETGTGALVFANSPTLVTPALGTPASGVVTNLTGTASININGTVGATTASTGAFTNLAYTGTLTGGTGVMNLGSGQLVKGANGNVGIGTSAPGAKLNVEQTATGNFTSLLLSRTTGSIGNEQSIVWQQNDLSNLQGASIAGSFDGSTAGSLRFKTASSSTLTERLRITSAGNVGIGTSSPATQLTVGRAGANTELRVLRTNEAPDFYGSIRTVGLDVVLDGAKTANYRINVDPENATAESTFIVNIDNTERLRITNAGNVGIGTSSPEARLSVVSSNPSGVGVSVLSSTSGTALACNTSFNETGRVITLRAGFIGGDAPALAFNTGSPGIDRLRITSAGNVGIGVTAPGDKLEIGGAGAGIILASPNGTRYRITVDNAGVLTSTAV